MDSVSLFFQLFVSGIAIGAIMALYTLGLSIIWGTSRIINIAHGEFLLIGAYVAYLLHQYFVQTFGAIPNSSILSFIEPFIYFPIAGIVVGCVALIVQYLLYNRVVGKEPIISLILGFGVSIILAGLLVVLFTANFRFETTSANTTAFNVLGLTIQKGYVIAIILSFSVFIVTYLFMERTDTGRAIRAVSQDKDAALLMGVNDNRIFMTAMFISGFVDGIGGSVIAVLYTFDPNAGAGYLGWSFVITVLAGLGTIEGVFIAGILIGEVSSLTTYVGAVFLNISGVEPAVGFIIMIMFIIVRPLGLFGRRSE